MTQQDAASSPPADAPADQSAADVVPGPTRPTPVPGGFVVGVDPSAPPLHEQARDVAGEDGVHRLPQEERDALPPQVPGIGGTFLGPTHTVAGTPNAAAEPEKPRLGFGAPLGETQPGVPPSGEQERVVDPAWREQRAEGAEDAERVTGASFANGVVTIRHGGGRILRVNLSSVESIDDDGDKITITLASGRDVDLSGPDASVVRPHLVF